MSNSGARRACARCLFLLLGLPALAVPADDESAALALSAAQDLAVTGQPLLEAQASMVEATRQTAIAARQLPDPQLTGGVTDLPIEGADRYSLRQDDFTLLTVGVMQTFPRAAKRRLLGERGEHEAEVGAQMLTATRLEVRRDAALAWLEAWQPERAAELARASIAEAQLQSDASEIAYRSGRATQADALAARVTLALLQDDLAGDEQAAQVARSRLSRWIGAQAAERPLSPDLPQWPAVTDLETLLARHRSHPHLNAQAERVRVAEDDVALAQQAYAPDWGVELEYANRPDFADYVSLNFRIDLPVFSHNRQDRGLAAKLAGQEQAEQMRDDTLRQEEAALRAAWLAWRSLEDRLHAFDATIGPGSEERVAAAVASWQSGQGSMATVLDARRTALDLRVRRLEVLAEGAKQRVMLQYFAGE